MFKNILKNKIFILVFFILAQTPVFSQTQNFSHGPIELGAAFGAIGPVGDFRNNIGGVDFGERAGLNLNLITDMNRSGILRLRFDVFAGNYTGDEALYIDDYNIGAFSLGPEVGLSKGPILPYMNAGYQWIWHFFDDIPPGGAVEKQIRESVQGGSGWLVGGGMRIPLGSRKRWAIDIGLRYHHGGTASYLTNDGVKKNPDETFTVVPTQSQMRFMLFTLGFQWRPFLDRKPAR